MNAPTHDTITTLLTTLALIIIILGASTHAYIFTPRIYHTLTDAHSINPDAHAFSNGIIDFLLGDDTAIPALNAREQSHMYDVRTLIELLASAYILALLYLLWAARAPIVRTCSIYASITLITIAVSSILIPFPTLFDRFHRALFANGTWLFPIDSILIQTYPAAFFNAFFTLILETALAVCVTILVAHAATHIRTRMFNHNKP